MVVTTYQPSGHINVSRAREFYLQFASSYCASGTPCDLLVLAKAINFLLISDGLKQYRTITVDCSHSYQVTMKGKQCKLDRIVNQFVYNPLVSYVM